MNRRPCCLCAGLELFVCFEMDNGVAELKAAFATSEISVELILALCHGLMFNPRITACFRQTQRAR
jgi:hypothetical protein